MITVQARIYSRMTADVANTNGNSLQTLLGGSGRIMAGLDYTVPLKAPCIAFNSLSNIPGSIDSDYVVTEVEIFTFKIFSDRAQEIISRLRQLLDRYTFAETTEAGVLKCVWDSDGPDLFDEDLKCRRKDTRFRIYSAPKAVGPV